jgi:hypothetical protein
LKYSTSSTDHDDPGSCAGVFGLSPVPVATLAVSEPPCFAIDDLDAGAVVDELGYNMVVRVRRVVRLDDDIVGTVDGRGMDWYDGLDSDSRALCPDEPGSVFGAIAEKKI